jgi:hypothetical protein
LPLLRALYNFNVVFALVQLLLQICKFLYRIISAGRGIDPAFKLSV